MILMYIIGMTVLIIGLLVIWHQHVAKSELLRQFRDLEEAQKELRDKLTTN